MSKARLRALFLSISLLSWAADTVAADSGSPTYDATGDWRLHVEGPHLLAGDCEVMEEPGYAESVHIQQERGNFVISTEGGQIERGTISGSVYTHSASQQGTDITGMLFSLRTRSTFTLTSADKSVGETVLDLRFEDGTECLLDLRFEGERVQHEGRKAGDAAAPLRSA